MLIYFMMDFVTGEKLQSIAEITLLDNFNPNNNKYSKHIVNYNEKSLQDHKNEFFNKTIIFVKTDFIKKFIDVILPSLTNNIVIITHNADECITEKYIDALNDSLVCSKY